MKFAGTFIAMALYAMTAVSHAQNKVDAATSSAPRPVTLNPKKNPAPTSTLETDKGCTKLAKSEWLSLEEMALLAKHRGYQFEKVKISYESCYEIYGSNKAGDLVEAYFDPSNAKLVRQNIVKIQH